MSYEMAYLMVCGVHTRGFHFLWAAPWWFIKTGSHLCIPQKPPVQVNPSSCHFLYAPSFFKLYYSITYRETAMGRITCIVFVCPVLSAHWHPYTFTDHLFAANMSHMDTLTYQHNLMTLHRYTFAYIFIQMSCGNKQNVQL